MSKIKITVMIAILFFINCAVTPHPKVDFITTKINKNVDLLITQKELEKKCTDYFFNSKPLLIGKALEIVSVESLRLLYKEIHLIRDISEATGHDCEYIIEPEIVSFTSTWPPNHQFKMEMRMTIRTGTQGEMLFEQVYSGGKKFAPDVAEIIETMNKTGGGARYTVNTKLACEELFAYLFNMAITDLIYRTK